MTIMKINKLKMNKIIIVCHKKIKFLTIILTIMIHKHFNSLMKANKNIDNKNQAMTTTRMINKKNLFQIKVIMNNNNNNNYNKII